MVLLKLVILVETFIVLCHSIDFALDRKIPCTRHFLHPIVVMASIQVKESDIAVLVAAIQSSVGPIQVTRLTDAVEVTP